MQKVKRGGVSLAFKEFGSGPQTILFIHGWSGNHTFLLPQIQHFSASHRVIAVDLRGHGESDAPDQEYTMAGFADDMAWLCEQLEVKKPIVVSFSMGGNGARCPTARPH
ncbi:MAG TPA: alpha/beta hydrolase [Bryobacteraceae bacterium]|nr:alpha/beta hydrolase [Bryobacteraceae bacterium]